jgi:hypothetical protein
LITSNFMPMQLQNTDNIQKGITVGIGFCEKCLSRVFADEDYIEIDGKMYCTYCNPYNIDADGFEVKEELGDGSNHQGA